MAAAFVQLWAKRFYLSFLLFHFWFILQVALTFVLGCAYGAPSDLAVASPLGYAGWAGAPLAAAPLVAAPLAAPAVAVPAPYSVDTQAAGVTSIHQPAPVVTKEVHLGQTSYISGYATAIHKPPTPYLAIQVPTVLRGSQVVNAPVVKTVTQVHTVNEPVYVERRVEVPYDVPVVKEQIVEVPTPVHVDRPYAVPQPYPVAGEPIIKKTVAEPIITHSHHAGLAAAPLPVAANYGW
jgi:hypothetical protein